MKLTIKFDDTDSDANRRAGILFSELGKVFNPEEPKPMRVFGSREPETVEEALKSQQEARKERPVSILRLLEFLLPMAQKSVGSDTVLLVELSDGGCAFINRDPAKYGWLDTASFENGLTWILQAIITEGKKALVWRIHKDPTRIHNMDDCMRFIGTLGSDHAP